MRPAIEPMAADQEAGSRPRPALHLRRVFDAPRELVWLAWTRPAMALNWLGPVEWPAVEVTQDLRVGGAWSALLKSAHGDETLRQGGVYREIDPPNRLVFTFKWGDHHEDGAPVDTIVTVVLTEITPDRTLMEFTHQHLKSSDSARGHRDGWTSSFERLGHWLSDQAQQEKSA
ncbi:MAG: Activator of Hsp90 ATPase 1 family protein [Alphaproteobacteria bacterium]|nr:Activator of Hsp90 ATPase 1 family protein [Alphaproteobacteria bacterium]